LADGGEPPSGGSAVVTDADGAVCGAGVWVGGGSLELGAAPPEATDAAARGWSELAVCRAGEVAGPERASARRGEADDGGEELLAGAGGCSAGRVTVPDRLKFCNSLGPTVSVAGALVEAAGAPCAASGAGPSMSPAVQPAIAMRNPPLIDSRSFVRGSPIVMARQAHARRTTAIQAQLR
jgi:hypothetical protein